ncbi:MAG: indolepyruvate ferredoxin oxidoreductase family protein [Alphaproteobacteria bacterium]|nr:indolepyruvate ferredoxin oxidoreductase family protein [Alphaproteobacteria bacterium]
MTLASVTLDDKYTLVQGRVFLSAIQALVRLPMLQRQLDLAAGKNTAGFISGYRGSPMGGYDQALWRARDFLKDNHVVFNPGVNEDLAMTSVWGTQMTNLYADAKYDGVFGIWYAKGPGLDRSIDALKHGNAAGTSPFGGVLCMVGDDHGAVSSTLAHQSEFDFMAAMVPVLAPSSVQEYVDLGLFGWAMSRAAGLFVGFKLTSEGAESSSTVDIDPARHRWIIPSDIELPPGGLSIRWPDNIPDQEARLSRFKIPVAQALARANGIDRVVLGGAGRGRLGLVTAGKAALDLRQALDDLGIDAARAERLGIKVYKLGLTWPVEPEGLRRFAETVDELFVVEEKRPLIEAQVKDLAYNWPADKRPRVVGKIDETGAPFLPAAGELSPMRIAAAIAERLRKIGPADPQVEERAARIDEALAPKTIEIPKVTRQPYFCSGCPHNTSTRVPEGSRATAGIGCHFMAVWMDRNTATFTQMGGEGTPWIGQAHFTDCNHIFANLGDGTYYHSGLLALRAAVAAKVNITYKILFNDAVAMTGGQPHDGPLTVPQITRQVAAEGVGRIAVVTDEPNKYPIGTNWGSNVTVHHRDDLDKVQRALREIAGCTVVVYDQTCAAEKRRRRKRGTFPDPDRRVFINEAVCEGCGDCGMASNCMSVVPIETEFGRKRAIDQSSCNKDFSCLKGFCPSFVSVTGAKPRRAQGRADGEGGDPFATLPTPEVATSDAPYDILVTGVGGTGVVTVSAILGMAAHLEGKGATLLDQTGLAQKGGAVLSHVRICKDSSRLHAVRIVAGGAELVLGGDLVVSAGREAMMRMERGRTRAIVNAFEIPVAAGVRNPDAAFDAGQLKRLIRDASGDNLAEFVDATGIATALMGDSIATNLFLVGYAAQRGLLPVSVEAIERAVELNAVSVNTTLRALRWGRLAAHDPAAVQRVAKPLMRKPREKLAQSLAEVVARRAAYLVLYQDRDYAERYKDFVAEVEEAERGHGFGMTGLAMTAARSLFKLMAYKDEYEVARLFVDPGFEERLKKQFEGDFKVHYHLAPPLVATRDPETGELKKSVYGPWIKPVFRVIAALRGLRGGFLDLFGRSEERKLERRMIAEYMATIREMLKILGPDNHKLAIEIAALPQSVRGFGHVKERNHRAAMAKQAELLALYRGANPDTRAAA